MTFSNPSKNGPIIGIIALLFIGIIGSVFFFSFKECGKSGLFRSGKTSYATDLYQVFPAESNGKSYLISLEGVYKTRLYERNGGMTTRSGSTDIRLTLHDMETGAETERLVLGDYHEAYTKILGVGKNVLWLYNKKDGLHSRNISDFEIETTSPNIIYANSDLAEGFAMAQDYLGNVEELYNYNKYDDALMITTISGKRIWLNAGTFKTIDPPVAPDQKNDLDDLIDEIVNKAMKGQTPEIEKLYDQIIQSASDLSAFSDIAHTSNRITGADSCDYSFDGNTVKTIVKSNCKQPEKINTNKETTGIFIEPVFLSEFNTAEQKYINPGFLGNDHTIIFHSKSIGAKSDLLISLVNTRTLKADYTIKTGIVLNNPRASFNIAGTFSSGDTLFTAINNQLFSINITTGKIYWKTIIGKDDYYSQIYYLGTGTENGKKYFIVASNYFTTLSQQGNFKTGRIDYQILITDAETGKTIKRMEATDSKPENLPYFLGMANNKAWFYSIQDGIHVRSIYDLKIIEGNFAKKLTEAGIESTLVKTSGYDGAIEGKYIAMESKNNKAYFTTENGLHYAFDLLNGNISEVKTPDDKTYESWMSDNPSVEYYRVRHQNMFQHELFLGDGRILSFEENNSVAKLIVKERKPETNNLSSPKTNQFIEAEFLTNGISINNQFNFINNRSTPLSLNPAEKTFYILHKNKISPDAHQIISKFNYENETVIWAFDITNQLGIQAELLRIYSLNDKFYFIFKTHPGLDDNFVCVAVDADKGKVVWNMKF